MAQTQKEYQHGYYIAHKEKILQQSHDYYVAHKEAHLERCRQYSSQRKEERRAYLREYHIKHKNESRIWHRAYRDAHKQEIVARQRKYCADNREEIRLRKIERQYGLSREEYRAKIETQDGRCLICGLSPNGARINEKRLHVDHDHATGKVRGLLCAKCNKVLGLLGDNIDLFKKAIQYLEDYATPAPTQNILRLISDGT